jgi:transcriptional regulator with XRE-family HTH domain
MIFYYHRKMSFRDNLREALDFSGMEQRELAVKTGISLKTIENYVKKDSSVPSADKAVLIAQALGVTVEYLVTGNDSKQTRNVEKFSSDILIIAQLAEQLDDENRKFVIDFLKWLKNRKTKE